MEKETNYRLIIALALGAGAIAGILVQPLVSQYGKLSVPVERLAGSLATSSAGTLRETVYRDEETATIEVVEKVNPAVVSIAILQDVSQLRRPRRAQTFPFDDFFFGFPFELQLPEQGPPPRAEEREPDLRQVGGGSGFIIESDGLIVTNRHVVDSEQVKYKVILANGDEHEAKVLAKDPVLDVALLQIEVKDLPTLKLGDSDKLRLGQTVIAIGYALSEFGNTVTRGVVSGIGRRIEAGDGQGFSEVLEEAIQTDAAINPGNSGGPLLNLAGEVVGINTAVSSRGQSVGFAIPINNVKKTIESVRATGRIVRPWLGVRFMLITPRVAEVNKLPVKYGALIVRGESREELAVVPGSPADKAGLVENDIILEINGKKLEDRDSLSKEIAKYNVSDKIILKVLHKGEEKEVKVTLGEFPGNKL